MSGAMEWLLDLETLRPGAESVRFAFERPAPLYLWVGLGAAAVVIGVVAYRRLPGPSALRWVLAGLRAALLLLLAVLIAGPSFERREETSEPDWLLVLVDRSTSMGVMDASLDQERSTREAQLQRALAEAAPAVAALGENRRVKWFGFGDGTYELGVDDQGLPVLDAPLGRRTNLAGAIETALKRAVARPIAGMLVLSDGRATDAPAKTDLRALIGAGAPLHAVPLGSATAVADVAVRRVSAPTMAFKDDPTPVTVEFVTRGEPGARVAGEVRLVDEATDGVLETRRVSLAAGVQDVVLTHQTDEAGAQRWRVEFIPDEPDLIAPNNFGSASLEIVDRPLRVLYLDGYPRWEQRYLRNLLIREGSIESSNLMLAAGRRYLQEGDVEIASLPSSPEEWSRYDVVILGDLDPGVLTPAQIDQIQLFVAEDGGGLVWIAGESQTPRAWWSTPLAALLPFQKPVSPLRAIGEVVQVHATAEAERVGVLRLLGAGESGWPEELTDPLTAWSALHWAQDIDPALLKPSASVLASAAPLAGEPRWPLVMTMRYGAGRAVYVGTDEIWRWRYGRGELLYERFWIQLVRHLGNERLMRGALGYTVAAGSETAEVGEPVAITVELLDQSLVESSPEVVRLRAVSDAATLGVQNEIEFDLPSTGERRGRYAGVWTPPAAGRWTIRAIDPQLAGAGGGGASAVVEARLPGSELVDPRPDHALLAALASMTGGEVIAPGELSKIADPGVFPSRSVRRVMLEREALWDTPLALMLLVGLAGLEWIGRRLLRLL